MAWVGSVNQSITHGGASDALFTIKTALKLAGWVVVQTGGGTAGVVTSTDQLTTVVLFNVTGAWARMREPVAGPVQREYILQMGTANSAAAIIKYSRATGFTTGATTTVSPTTGGGDGQLLNGTGSDAAPVAVAVAVAGGYCHAIASDTASAGVYGAYAWYFFSYLTPVTSANFNLIFTEPVAPGSTSVLDQDPTIRFAGGGGVVIAQAPASVAWWQAYGLVGATYITGGSAAIPVGAANIPLFTLASISPYDSKVPMFPVMVAKPLLVYKGYTTGLLQFNTTQNLTDTFNLSTADARIAVGVLATGGYSAAVPWVTGVVPLV